MFKKNTGGLISETHFFLSSFRCVSMVWETGRKVGLLHIIVTVCTCGVLEGVGACYGNCTEVRGRLTENGSLLLSLESWGLNSSHQAWQQSPLPTKPPR